MGYIVCMLPRIKQWCPEGNNCVYAYSCFQCSPFAVLNFGKISMFSSVEIKSILEKPYFLIEMLLNTSVVDGQRHAFFGYCRIFVELLLIFTLLRKGKTSLILESGTAILASETLETAKEAVCPLCPLLLLQLCKVSLTLLKQTLH